MKKFKSFSTRFGITFAIFAFSSLLPFDSSGQEYSYKIIVAYQTVPVPGGFIVQSVCYHGPGLCGPTSPMQ